MTMFATLVKRLLLLVAPLLVVVAESPAQSYRFRLAHLITGVSAVDAYLNGGTTPYLTDVPFESQSARSASFTGALGVKITAADQTAALVEQTLTLEGDRIYSLVAYGTAASAKLAVLPWRFDQVPAVDFANVRVLNATTMAGGIDVYFDSTEGLPAIAALARDSASLFVTMPAHSASMYITAAGSKTPLAIFTAPLANRSIQTLVVTGSDAATLAVRSLNEGLQAVDQVPLTTLLREQAVGAIPTLRFVHAFPQPDANRLDVYIGGTTKAASGINYRGASGVLANIGVGDVRLTLVPADRSPNDSVYGTTLTLARDTAYSVILTQFRSGAPVILALKRSHSGTPPAAGKAKIRLANVTDFYTNLEFALTGAANTTIALPQFLTATDWLEIDTGLINLRVQPAGTTTPMFEGSYRAPEGAFLTMLAIGDESTFTVDVINHSDPGSQIPLGSFGAQATSVREEIAAATRALSLGARPNPSAGDARVHFTLAAASDVTLELYDALGRRVLTLADAHLAAGAHAVAIGGELEPGAYTAVLRAGEATAAAPVIVVR